MWAAHETGKGDNWALPGALNSNVAAAGPMDRVRSSWLAG